MDNFHIDITADGRTTLEMAMQIAFAHNAPGLKAEGYCVSADKGLVLLWSANDSASGTVGFPFKMDQTGAADFVSRWLSEQSYGPEPDHDGDNGKGWRLYCEGWGHVGNLHYAICAVKPAWAMYGK